MKAFRYRIRLQVRQVLPEGVRHGKTCLYKYSNGRVSLEIQSNFSHGFWRIVSLGWISNGSLPFEIIVWPVLQFSWASDRFLGSFHDTNKNSLTRFDLNEMGLIIYFLFFLQGIVQDQTAKSIVSNRAFHPTFSKNNQTNAGNFLSVPGSLIKRAQCRTNMQNNRIEFFYNYNGEIFNLSRPFILAQCYFIAYK